MSLNARPLGGLVLTGLFLFFATTPAPAAEAPSHPFLFSISEFTPSTPTQAFPPEALEGPCGVALDSHGDIYVSDYYHHNIDVFSSSGAYLARILAEDSLDGPCGLAVDSAGDVYVANYHHDVVELRPSSYPPGNATTYGSGTVIDPGPATGVALDPATGDVYVDDRAYVAVYEPSGAPVLSAGEPLRIGLGALGEGYGVAVSDYLAAAGDIYVLDARTKTIEVFNPATSTTTPIAAIDGQGTPQAGFDSLTDSTIAVDQSDGHLFVADNPQSYDYEHPMAVIDEFNSAGEYRGQLESTILDSEPPGVAIEGYNTSTKGNVYVTSGNSEEASVDVFGPTAAAHVLEVVKTGGGEGTVTSEPAGIRCGAACAAEYNEGAEVTLTAVPSAGSAFAGWSGGGCSAGGSCTVTMSEAISLDAEFALDPGFSGVAAAGLSPGPATSAEATSAPASPVRNGGGRSAAAPASAHARQRMHRKRHRHHAHERHRRRGSGRA